MKTLRITDIEGNLVVRTEIDTSNDNFSWIPQAGSCIILGGVSLTENSLPSIEDHADQYTIEFINNHTNLPIDGKAHRALVGILLDFYEKISQ